MPLKAGGLQPHGIAGNVRRKESERRMKHRVVLTTVAMILVLPLLGIYGCGGNSGGREGAPTKTGEETVSGREIPLQTLLQGSICDYGRFEEPISTEEVRPAFLVMGDEEELKRLLFLSGLELSVSSIDFEDNIVIAAMQGPKNTAGYAISVVHAVQSGTEVRVEVEVVEPEPGSVTAQVFTSPYHLVLAKRSDFQPRGELIFNFTDTRGENLGTLSVNI